MEGSYIPPTDGFTLGEHTADLWLEVSGASLEECVQHSLSGLYHVMAQEYVIKSFSRVSLPLVANNEQIMIIDILSEALFLFDVEGALMLDANLLRDDDGTWVLEFTKAVCSIPEGKGGMEVKAATFHGPGLIKENGRWSSRVLLDL